MEDGDSVFKDALVVVFTTGQADDEETPWLWPLPAVYIDRHVPVVGIPFGDARQLESFDRIFESGEE